MTEIQEHVDVVVVGGGAAGLAGALTLARSRRSVVVLDAGEPRNAPAHGVHNYLGREGVAPGDLVATGVAEVERYGGRVVAAAVRNVVRVKSGFEVTTDTAVYTARRLLVATGVRDDLPDVPGLAQRWGRDVLHCPYCHGWEVRDQPIGVLGSGGFAVHQALLFRQWSADVTFFPQQVEVSDADAEKLAARGVTVVPGRVEGLVVESDRLTGVTVDGAVVPVSALAVQTAVRPRVPAGLDLPVTEDFRGAWVTGGVDGVWVAGNIADLSATVAASAASGVWAASQLNFDLVEADTKAAVDEYRAADTTRFWEGFYRDRDAVWSGKVNPLLEREAAGTTPGTALDLGCGEGADAVWLRAQGWRVTAVDVSDTALARAAGHAADAGFDDIDWQRHDLDASFPEGRFDLVSAQFFHSPHAQPGERDKVLRRAAEAVAPGGVLLIGSHAEWPSWVHEAPAHIRFPTIEEMLTGLALDEAEWTVETAEVVAREITSPHGEHGTRGDSILRIRRH